MKPFTFILATFISYLFLSCSNYKYVYFYTDDKIASDLSVAHSKYLKTDELYLAFTGVYNQSKIKIYENDSILFYNNFPIDKKYITKSFKINNNSKLTIYFEDIKKTINNLLRTNEKL